MPPWKPDADHGEFLDERKLSPNQIATLKAWVEAGTPEGDPKNAPKPPAFKTGWKLGQPDIILKMPEPFKIPAEGKDVYWAFVFPLNLKKEIHIRGVECRPGNPKVAHHAVGILDSSGTAKKLDAKHAGPGYPGLNLGFVPSGFTPGYVPGQTPRFLKDGQAITVRKGTDFVLQMHYHPTGKDETDQTEIGLYLTDQPPTEQMVVVALATQQIDIPAGKQDYKGSDQFTLPVDMEVDSIWNHQHTIGKTARVWAELPSKKGEVKLLRISDWDFNWQDTYLYRQPIKLPKGTIIHAEWTWDNSAGNPRNPNSPPKRIRLGEGSNDEMSGLILGGRTRNWADSLSHWGAVLGHYVEIEVKGWPFKK